MNVWDPVARRWLDHAGPAVDAATARGWVAAGRPLVGGCCRVGPDRIAELVGGRYLGLTALSPRGSPAGSGGPSRRSS